MITSNCPDCGVGIGKPHINECDVERCSICGHQRITCECETHDPAKSIWTGEWPTNRKAELPPFMAEAIHEDAAEMIKSKMGSRESAAAEEADEPIEDEEFLAELEGEEESLPHNNSVGVMRDIVPEDFGIAEDQYQWRRFDLDLNARRQPAADLRWWNGYDGILVGMVRQEAAGFQAAARLDRRDEASEGLDVLGIYPSVEAAQTAVVEACRSRWHRMAEYDDSVFPKVNWQEVGF
jgi:hypothetical protein